MRLRKAHGRYGHIMITMDVTRCVASNTGTGSCTAFTVHSLQLGTWTQTFHKLSPRILRSITQCGSFSSAKRPLSRSNMFPAPERGTEGSDRQCRGTIPFGGQPQCTVSTKYRSQGVETHAHWTCSSANNHVVSFDVETWLGSRG